jgi:ribonuclease HII
MDYFERMFQRRGYLRIAGVDEVGRGPLAGPVVAAAVVLPEQGVGQPLFDSKQLTPRKREELCPILFREALDIGLGVVGQEEIDRLNILQATLKAMTLAVERLRVPPDFILIDGLHPIPLSVSQKAIPKGDQLSQSIAAASIIAKVTRDRMMEEYHRQYPQYNFSKHKGYGTEEHLEAIRTHGVCDLHRKTFRGVREYLK